MENEKIEQYKKALLKEKTTLEAELSHDAVQDPKNPADWEAKGSDINERSADPNKLADNIEEDLTNDGIVNNLATRLQDVNVALGKIEAGTYGTCSVDNSPIEEDRLNANPAATTCMTHMNE